METYTIDRNESERHLATARSFVSRYDTEAAIERPNRFLMKYDLLLASVYYYLALGICLDYKQREVIAQEKGGIEAKLKELERNKPS